MPRTHLTIDPWTPLDYKQAFGSDDPTLPGPRQNAPWLTTRDRRRLSAYLVLAAYMENAARYLHESDRADERREYGDAALLTEQALTALLGEDQTVVAPAADGYDPDPAEGADPPKPGAADAYAMQTRLREWVDDENFLLTLLAGERKACALGDAVYLLQWDAVKQRPRVNVIDPGLYFPVLPEGIGGDGFPTRVHFLWETPADEDPDGEERLTRVTYEVGPITPLMYAERDWLGRANGEDVLHPGDRWEVRDGVRVVTRQYPWSEERSTQTCYLTQVEWRKKDIGAIERGGGVDALDASRGRYAVRASDGATLNRLDLRLDFLPIIHVPNTVPGEEHYGQAVITKVAQVLDDLHSADTDSNAASATTGSPMIGARGMQATMTRDPNTGQAVPMTLRIAPGTVWPLEGDGELFTVDTSGQLREMREYVDDLRDRLTRNARIVDTDRIAGGGSAADLSGIAIRLRYGPMEGLIGQMRLARSAKYPILLKFVQRMFMLATEYDGPTVTTRVDLEFGSFIPRDTEGTMKSVAEAYRAKVISLETAVTVLVQAGVPIDDAVEEVRRIESRDTETANGIADATGDGVAARAYLGLPEVPTAQGGSLPAGGGRPATDPANIPTS